MKNKKIYFLVPFLLLLSFGCEDYIQNVDPLIDRVEDARLNNEAAIVFVATGVKQRFATIASNLSMQADLLSDQMVYQGDVPSASFPTFEEMEKGQILLDNASSTGTFLTLGELRFFADDLVRRANSVTPISDAIKNSALFTGNFYGGIARFYMAVYFGLNPNQPGGVINAGPFIPQSQLLDQAIEKMKAALAFTTDAAEQRYVHSMITKTYLAKSDYTNAAAHAAGGMQKGDKDFLALYNDVSNISYWGFAGAGRVQIIVNDRFNDYIKADPKEANRIKLATTKGRSGKIYYYQMKYPDKFSNFIVMTWQENNLMLAELALRGAGTGNALALVNDVRASRGLDPLTSINIDGVLVERDKELFVQGVRLIDQNRTGKWHLAAGTWQYFPIPRRERDANPNLPAN